VSKKKGMGLVPWIALALILCTGLVAGCGGAGSAGIEEGPGMLYFYAEW
jgi:hypothetical protein